MIIIKNHLNLLSHKTGQMFKKNIFYKDAMVYTIEDLECCKSPMPTTLSHSTDSVLHIFCLIHVWRPCLIFESTSVLFFFQRQENVIHKSKEYIELLNVHSAAHQTWIKSTSLVNFCELYCLRDFFFLINGLNYLFEPNHCITIWLHFVNTFLWFAYKTLISASQKHYIWFPLFS